MRLDKRIMARVLVLGASPFFMTTSEGIMHICFNMQVLKYGGDLAVGAMTILLSFFFAFFRKVILLIPLLYILPEVFPWGVLAVTLAEPVSDLLTTFCNKLYFTRFLQRKFGTADYEMKGFQSYASSKG